MYEIDSLVSACNCLLTVLISLYQNKTISYESFIENSKTKIDFIKSHAPNISSINEKELAESILTQYKDIQSKKITEDTVYNTQV